MIKPLELPEKLLPASSWVSPPRELPTSLCQMTAGAPVCILVLWWKPPAYIHSSNTGTAVAGQNTTYLPHKGTFSPAEKVLYVSYSDGAGPVSDSKGICIDGPDEFIPSMTVFWVQSGNTMSPHQLVSNSFSSFLQAFSPIGLNYRDGHNTGHW